MYMYMYVHNSKIRHFNQNKFAKPSISASFKISCSFQYTACTATKESRRFTQLL